MDIEETAVEIAAFSLCLTAFELDPVPNSRHQLKFKHELKGRTLFVGDAFDEEASFRQATPLKEKQIDVVVGNPPWTRPKGPRSASPSGEKRYVEYSRARRPKPVTLPFRDPPDQAFVWRASDFAQKRARFGFVLEGKRFFSTHPQSLKAKAELLSEFSPRMMANLAALHREDLFPSAQQPAIVLILQNEHVSRGDTFPFVAVERDLSFREHGLMRIGPENVQRLSASFAASDPHALKVASWGSARDMALVNRLIKDCDSSRCSPKRRGAVRPPDEFHVAAIGPLGFNQPARPLLQPGWFVSIFCSPVLRSALRTRSS